jgi:hypothetical protein
MRRTRTLGHCAVLCLKCHFLKTVSAGKNQYEFCPLIGPELRRGNLSKLCNFSDLRQLYIYGY